MNSKKIYIRPAAEITEFECEDVITTSGGPARSLKKSPNAETDYIIVQSKKWSDLFGDNQ
ncbi:MAG TPA: hypothetical protein H9900_01255 [Candidatus Monoglobus merdigallinarum]|uniref:Uncharacterized protein n=1 Tax=Candidatus Monoglobus merdigallinarum TaxID=2838698 RepID=A0A9D1PQ83_9FIRM|nr:hypothetical protein [Candidatus Monoglobus merdigallinarum]